MWVRPGKFLSASPFYDYRYLGFYFLLLFLLFFWCEKLLVLWFLKLGKPSLDFGSFRVWWLVYALILVQNEFHDCHVRKQFCFSGM